jgi:hypothetical protein
MVKLPEIPATTVLEEAATIKLAVVLHGGTLDVVTVTVYVFAAKAEIFCADDPFDQLKV